MKRLLYMVITAVSAGIIAAGSAFALSNGWANGTFDQTVDFPANAAANGIAATRHNLGSFGSFVTTNKETGTTEICVFCHTPHHTQNGTDTGLNPAPLWNRVNAAVYSGYGSTIGGSNPTGTGITVSSVSQACLSCHDGVTTFDNIVNAPGAGGVIAPATPGAYSLNWAFMNDGTPGGMSNMPGNSSVLTAPDLASSQYARLNIGTNLSNDHPMSITYYSDRASLRDPGTVISSINLTKGLQVSANTAYGGNLMQNRWAVKGYISDTVTIQDVLRNGKVECSSCHDPHFKNTSWDEIDNKGAYLGLHVSEFDGLFLRRVGGNTGSGVCRTCHNK